MFFARKLLLDFELSKNDFRLTYLGGEEIVKQRKKSKQ